MKHQIILKITHFLSGLLKFKNIANPENITVKLSIFQTVYTSYFATGFIAVG